jgi:uncharacterized membrane protein
MNVRPEFLAFIAVLAVASLLCRFGGFWLMRFVTITPRLEAALKATPLAVMVGLVTPAAIKGGVVEWAAIAAITLAMKLTRNDLLSAAVGVVVVALGRSLKFGG